MGRPFVLLLTLLANLAFATSPLFAQAPTQAGAAPDAASEEHFERRVRPILVDVCFRCHGGQKVSGGLRVDSREKLISGGDSGSAIHETNPDASLLLKAIRREGGVSAMPPDKPLTAQQVADITAWIKSGARWPKAPVRFESTPHWAFQPVTNPKPPAVQATNVVRTDIDRFVVVRLEAEGRSLAPQADRRSLIRRVTYDLTGLPPKPEDVAAFVTDSSPTAFTNVVDRLLKSPHYGERWGRHWLDVVRYADTAGENSDHPLPHAWRYRNWVIESLNEDLPYNEFLRHQIAGDILAAEELAAAGNPESASRKIVATGYLAIARRFGHDIDKDMHLTLEDTIDTLGKSILGLTLGCARCHDHKYDPVTAADYYALYGIFDSTKFSFPGCEPKQQPRDLVPLAPSVEALQKVAEIDKQLATIDTDTKRISDEVAVAAKRLKELASSNSTGLARGLVDEGKSVGFDPSSAEGLGNRTVKKGDVLLLTVAPRGNHGADSTLVEWEIAEAGESKRRWNVSDLVPTLGAGNPHADTLQNPNVWCFLDLADGYRLLTESLSEINGRRELQAWRNGDTPSVFVNSSDQAVKVWTELGPKSFFVHPGPRGPVAVAWISPIEGTVTLKGRVADAHPGGPDGVEWIVEHVASAEVGTGLAALGEHRAKLTEAARRKTELNAGRPIIPVAYAVSEGTPHHAKLQRRGDPADLGDEVPRRFPGLLGGHEVKQTTASGRRELAEWLTAPSNPLTARVIVNRVWQGHFGRGLVPTPNDFGLRGTPPTHPELLDHLAATFVQSGWSLKQLHREICLSAVYQQGSTGSEWTGRYDNFPRRRLSAEEIRDTMLFVSGELDATPGQAHPFPAESTWSFTQHGPFAAEYDTLKRSVYVMQKRNRRSRFFSLFDGPDPNASTPLRDLTTVPTQALFFLNDPFLHARAAKFSARVLTLADSDQGRLDAAFNLLLGRSPTEEESRDAQSFLQEYADSLNDAPAASRSLDAWSAYARILLSGNEALHVD